MSRTGERNPLIDALYPERSDRLHALVDALGNTDVVVPETGETNEVLKSYIEGALQELNAQELEDADDLFGDDGDDEDE